MKKYFCDRCKRECDPQKIHTLAVLSIPKETTDAFEIEEELGDFCDKCILEMFEAKKEA